MRIVDDFAGLGRSFAAMDDGGTLANRSVDFRHTAESMRSIAKNCGNLTEAAVAFRQDEPVGYSVLLESRRRGEMWTYRTGQSANEDCSAGRRSASPSASTLRFAAQCGFGYRRLWLGPGDSAAKRSRGAEQIPLYSYFYFRADSIAGLSSGTFAFRPDSPRTVRWSFANPKKIGNASANASFNPSAF